MPLLELPNGAHMDFETIEVSSARLKGARDEEGEVCTSRHCFCSVFRGVLSGAAPTADTFANSKQGISAWVCRPRQRQPLQ